MNRDEQKEFVNDLTDNVRKEIIGNIENGKIPESWDGIELRTYIADRFRDAVMVKMNRGRKREYNNTILINNL